MNGNSSRKQQRKKAAAEEQERRENETLWFTWRELPLILLFLPFAILFGMHVAGFAMAIRRFLRIPYIVSMVALYALLTIPLWYGRGDHSIWFPASATAVVLLTTVAGIIIVGRQAIMEGSNFEHSAPAHIMLCLAYILLPALYAAVDAHGG